jgi:hypothetical protein
MAASLEGPYCGKKRETDDPSTLLMERGNESRTLRQLPEANQKTGSFLNRYLK